MKTITFSGIQNSTEKTEFYVLEQTKIAGRDYILVTDAKADEDGEAVILKEVGAAPKKEALASETEVLYEVVEDEHELCALAAVFAGLLEDDARIISTWRKN